MAMVTGQRTALVTAAVVLSGAFLIFSMKPGAGREQVTPLLSTGQTVLGEPFSYPTEAAPKVTSLIVAMQPGEETGWHKHGVPLYGYVLEGELTVDYGPKGTRIYRKGDAMMEAVGVPHNGRNTGAGVMRILAVFMGAEGVPNTVALKDAAPAK